MPTRKSPEPLAHHLQAAVAAQGELGGDYDGAVLRSFAERLDREIDARVEQRLPAHDRSPGLRDAVTIVIALGSIGFGVLFAAAADGLGSTGATLATIVAWAAIVAINVTHARARRPQPASALAGVLATVAVVFFLLGRRSRG